MASNGVSRQYLPLTCHGHSRPVPHISFSSLEKDGEYFIISACKDGNPMLRHGRTGDWIGTFIGHKGATWQAKQSPDNKIAASASADFSTKVWNAHTGEMLLVLKHDHVVRAVAFPLNISDILATGGHEKILRIWDLKSEDHNDERVTATVDAETQHTTYHIPPDMAHQIGEVHPDTIKFIVWPQQTTIITAAGKTLRWHDVSTRNHFKEEVFDSEIKACELVSLAPQYASPNDVGGGLPVLSIAAGKKVAFYGGADCTQKIKEFTLPQGIASVGLDLKNHKFVVGEEPGTWARVYDWQGQEIDIMKGHHGPIWSIQFAPDGKLYATGSEDGTIRMWKNCEEDYADPQHHPSARLSDTHGAPITPLSEISVNVAKVPAAALRGPQQPADTNVDCDPHWKTMLSPVAEESPSPRKKHMDEDLLVSYSPRKTASRPASPGSLKMQNFLRRLERQGLSHD
ncbi:hypothetical protein diail_6651 [Diaporthe ilicicola]|nr:hypothetical protein diail_6651 [Diaporthe ilicicola]